MSAALVSMLGVDRDAPAVRCWPGCSLFRGSSGRRPRSSTTPGPGRGDAGRDDAGGLLKAYAAAAKQRPDE